MSDPVPALITKAFVALCEAEKLVYMGGGASRDTKDHLNDAHSHLLALRRIYPEATGVRAS